MQHVHAADGGSPENSGKRIYQAHVLKGINMVDPEAPTDNVTRFPSATPEQQPGPKVRSKDSTSALRSKRYRRSRKRDAKRAPAGQAPQTGKRNEIKSSVTVRQAPPLVPDTRAHARTERHGRGIRFATLTAAIGLATVSGGFSIYGLTSIFVGAFWPVIGMGVALEVGKLSAVAWLGHQHGTASLWLRAALTILVVILMGLNAVGCYGFLAKAHIEHEVEGETAIGGRMAEIQGQISVQEGIVAALDRQIVQIDNAIAKATDKGRTNAAMQLAADQRRNRAELVAERVHQGKVLADLQVEKAKIDGDREVSEADLGPVRYLATLIGAGDQDVLRGFVLVVSCLLDPAAVLLLLAATRR